MDEIKTRLKDASDACLAKLEAWHGKNTDAAAREGLQEAVHELRKVTARIEIELAVSDRKTQGSEMIPIPAHRASRRPGGDFDMDDDRGQHGNRAQGRDGNRAQGGGHNSQGGGARPVQIRKAPEASSAPAAVAADANPGNDAAGGDEEGGTARKRPLSLKRTPDAE
jgi:hypothetical protein